MVAPKTHCKLSAWQASKFFKVSLALPIACLSLMMVAGKAFADSKVELRPLPADQVESAPVGTD
ncbi:hypothetical protein ABTH42_19585, partial [Acinetobacter baumannii]